MKPVVSPNLSAALSPLVAVGSHFMLRRSKAPRRKARRFQDGKHPSRPLFLLPVRSEPLEPTNPLSASALVRWPAHDDQHFQFQGTTCDERHLNCWKQSCAVLCHGNLEQWKETGPAANVNGSCCLKQTRWREICVLMFPMGGPASQKQFAQTLNVSGTRRRIGHWHHVSGGIYAIGLLDDIVIRHFMHLVCDVDLIYSSRSHRGMEPLLIIYKK
jgi:hypothetical protein